MARMTKQLARHAIGTLALTLAALLPAALPRLAVAGPVCLSSPNSGGIGGTGYTPLPPAPGDEHPAGGIGGTGARPADPTGGIGGTGSQATTHIGIIGTITGFASICVNGLEVHYTEATPASVNDHAASPNGLAVGQVVAIDAVEQNGSLVARNINVVHVLEGPITAIDPGRGVVHVMGQPVRMNGGPGGVPGKGNGSGNSGGPAIPGGVKVGMPVAVSGLYDASGTVVATYLASTPGLARASVMGVHRGATVGNVAVRVANAVNAAPKGAEVRVSGVWNGQQLDVAKIKVDPILPARAKLDRVVVEGFPIPGGSSPRVSGFDVVTTAATRFVGDANTALKLDRPVVVAGTVSRGVLLAERVETAEHARRGLEHRTLPVAAPLRTESILANPTRAETPVTPEASTHVAISTTEKIERMEKIEQVERPETVEKREKTEKPEKVEKAEKVEKVEKPEKVEKAEKVEKPEKIEKVEKVEKVERVEKVEKVERVEKIEKVEKVEKVEKLERPERRD